MAHRHRRPGRRRHRGDGHQGRGRAIGRGRRRARCSSPRRRQRRPRRWPASPRWARRSAVGAAAVGAPSSGCATPPAAARAAAASTPARSRRCVERRRRSLLAAGITGVDGEFVAGDVVELVGPDGRRRGPRAWSGFDAGELPALIGRGPGTCRRSTAAKSCTPTTWSRCGCGRRPRRRRSGPPGPRAQLHGLDQQHTGQVPGRKNVPEVPVILVASPPGGPSPARR